MRSSIAVLLAAALIVAGLAATADAAPAVRVTISATHTVRANAKWPVIVRVTNAAGKPLRATMTLAILLGSIPVGKVDNGKVFHFVGTWREPRGQEITWPPSARGMTFNLQATVRARGQTVKKLFSVRVR
jgi:hypothetical protein